MPHAIKCFAQVVKAAECILTGFYGTGELLHNAYELERCVVPFAKARLVNGENVERRLAVVSKGSAETRRYILLEDSGFSGDLLFGWGRCDA